MQLITFSNSNYSLNLLYQNKMKKVHFFKICYTLFMKILFVTDLYPIKNGEYSTPLTLHNFVCEWIKMGIEVDVLKPHFIFNSCIRNKPIYKTGIYDYD